MTTLIEAQSLAAEMQSRYPRFQWTAESDCTAFGGEPVPGVTFSDADTCYFDPFSGQDCRFAVNPESHHGIALVDAQRVARFNSPTGLVTNAPPP